MRGINTARPRRVNRMIAAMAAASAIGFPLAASQAHTPLEFGAPIDFSVKHPGGDPAKGLPAGSRQLTAFGTRPAWSPDGKRVAFMNGELGDAFEYDLVTDSIRNLTAHAPHKGLFRIHYLPDGNYVLTGLRRDKEDMSKSGRDPRWTDTQLFFLSKESNSQLVPLEAYIFEGLAVSRKTNKIAWMVADPRQIGPEGTETSSVVTVADVVVQGRSARLANTKVVAKVSWQKECYFEPQDFRKNDTEVAGSCGEINPATAARVNPASIFQIPSFTHSRLSGIDIDSGRKTDYFLWRMPAVAEMEGMSPDGSWTLVECAERPRGGPLEVCRFDFDNPRAMTRLTRAAEFGPYRFSNGVVSPDGRWAAVHFALCPASQPACPALQAGSEAAAADGRPFAVPPGTGDGIFLIPLP